MARSINCVYYRIKSASHNLVCQELCSVLLNRGHSVVLVLSEDATGTALRQKLIVQHGQISSQPLEAVAATSPSQPFVETEARWLRSQRAQVVISAAVPRACAAAAAAGVCAVCVANSTGGDAGSSPLTIAYDEASNCQQKHSAMNRCAKTSDAVLLALQSNAALPCPSHPCM